MFIQWNKISKRELIIDVHNNMDESQIIMSEINQTIKKLMYYFIYVRF